jgi:hypothetical protein
MFNSESLNSYGILEKDKLGKNTSIKMRFLRSPREIVLTKYYEKQKQQSLISLPQQEQISGIVSRPECRRKGTSEGEAAQICFLQYDISITIQTSERN